jgi:hypothetical protein
MKPLPLPRGRTRLAHLFALFGFAVVAPELQQLGKTPEYFVVRGYHSSDVLLYSITLACAVPLILFAVEYVAGRVHPAALAVVHTFFVCALLFLIFRDVVEKYAPNASVGASLVAVLVLVVVMATAYRFFLPVQMFMTIACFAPLLFLGTFLGRAHVTSMSVAAPSGVTMPVVHSKTPVALVVFDEFALSSLLTADGRIDRIRYPNFAALANTSTWFRRATTTYDVTDEAVPAILTGRMRRSDELPVVADYPRNLFTLLGRSYDVTAFQAETRLCPTDVCANASPAFGTRLGRVLSDIVTTSRRHKPLWEGDWTTPAAEVSHFVSALRPDESRGRPTLDMLHVLLPHVPYRYLPSGRAYTNPRILPGYGAGYRWAKNPWFVDHNYERFLLQLGYTDSVLGTIVRKLRSEGLWDRALVVVTADHGVSFHPGGHRRYVDSDNVGDIAPIPLFVKRPWEHAARVDSFSARSIDVVPTIADELGISLPWAVDGKSLFASGRRPPSTVVVHSYTGDVVKVPWRDVAERQAQTLAWKIRLYGSGEESVFAQGVDHRLLGKSVNAFASWRNPGLHVSLVDPSNVTFDPRSNLAPSRISGTVVGTPTGQALKLAVAVNGRVAAVTRTIAAGNSAWFSTFVPDTVLRSGQNQLAVLAVRKNPDGRLALAPVRGGGMQFALAAQHG